MKARTDSPSPCAHQAPGGSLLLALGANLPARDPVSGRRLSPPETLARAVQILKEAGFTLRQASRIYRTVPEGGKKGDPDYANAVVLAEACESPGTCLLLLKAIEEMFGRDPASPRMAARPLDLDLLAVDDLIWPNRNQWYREAAAEQKRSRERPLVLPHPHLHRRVFVLVPLREVAPRWRHPVTGRAIDDLLEEALATAPARPRPWPHRADLIRRLLGLRS